MFDLMIQQARGVATSRVFRGWSWTGLVEGVLGG